MYIVFSVHPNDIMTLSYLAFNKPPTSGTFAPRISIHVDKQCQHHG